MVSPFVLENRFLPGLMNWYHMWWENLQIAKSMRHCNPSPSTPFPGCCWEEARRIGGLTVEGETRQEMFLMPAGFLRLWAVSFEYDWYLSPLLNWQTHTLAQSKGLILATSNTTSVFFSFWSWGKFLRKNNKQTRNWKEVGEIGCQPQHRLSW